jgi:hypothetical protein
MSEPMPPRNHTRERMASDSQPDRDTASAKTPDANADNYRLRTPPVNGSAAPTLS